VSTTIDKFPPEHGALLDALIARVVKDLFDQDQPAATKLRAIVREAARAAVALDEDPVNVRIPEACRISGFSRSKLYRLAATKDVVFRKDGKCVLVDYASLKAAIARLPQAELNAASYT